MDFKGQLYCERFFQILVILFGLVGFVVGYIQQDFRLTFYFLATGGGLSAVVRTRPLPRPARTRSARRAGVYAAALHAAMSLATSPLLALCARRSAEAWRTWRRFRDAGGSAPSACTGARR